MRAKKIKYIVIHCTAGYKPADKVEEYFTKPKSQGGRGWNTGGYHRIIELDGTIKKMYDFNRITNGVANYNTECIHISYVGGLDRNKLKQGKFIAKDTRTKEQKVAIEQCIMEALQWLQDNGNNLLDVMILGHRDFSTDTNKDGMIASYERIKECPCFDAIKEYDFYNDINGIDHLLPSNR